MLSSKQCQAVIKSESARFIKTTTETTKDNFQLSVLFRFAFKIDTSACKAKTTASCFKLSMLSSKQCQAVIKSESARFIKTTTETTKDNFQLSVLFRFAFKIDTSACKAKTTASCFKLSMLSSKQCPTVISAESARFIKTTTGTTKDNSQLPGLFRVILKIKNRL